MSREIEESKRELSRVKELLSSEPRGLSITDISRILNMNRNSVSKYLNMLLVSGHVDMRTIGVAKVYFLSQRVPISAMLDFSSDCIIVLDADLRIVQMNDNYCDFSGYSREELVGRKVKDKDMPVLSDAIEPQHLEEVLRGREISQEVWWENSEEVFYFLLKMIPTVFDDGRPGATVILEDLTGIKQAEAELKEALDEKEKLLTEIHQRVRNNLQVISSLLSLQSASITDADTLGIVRQAQSRIEALALIHDHLHQSEDHVHINAEAYIREMVTALLSSYDVPEGAILPTVTAPGMSIRLDTGISVGLILSELVTNSIRHAFPDGRNGQIVIAAVKDDGGRVVLTVKDNGVGLPAEVCDGGEVSFGLMLVRTLVERQLKGTIEMPRGMGSAYTITFMEEG